MFLERKLTDAYVGTLWQDVDLCVLGEEFQERVIDSAEDLIGKVLRGECTVDDLRLGVVYANTLDAEAVKVGVSIVEASLDGSEALRRRFVHHVGRTALEATKTSHRRSITQARRANTVSVEHTRGLSAYIPDLSDFGHHG